MEFVKDIVDALKKNSEYKNYAQLFSEVFKKNSVREVVDAYINLVQRLPANVMNFAIQVLKDVSVRKHSISKDDQQQIHNKLTILLRKLKLNEIIEYFIILFEGNYQLSLIWLAYQDKKLMLEEFYNNDDITKTLLAKLAQCYENEAKSCEQVSDFEEAYLIMLEEKESDYFLDIVVNYEQKKQQLFNRNTIHNYIGNLVQGIGDDNLIQCWNACGDDLEQFKKDLKAMKGERQVVEELVRQIEITENYNLLIKVLKNYADIENNKIKQKQGELKRLIEVSNQRLSILEMKDKKMSLAELNRRVEEDTEFFNNFYTLKYFYKYLKLRKFQGEKRKERDLKQQLSMRTIALEHLLQILQGSEVGSPWKDDLKRYLQQGVGKLVDQVYVTFSKLHNEADFTKLFETYKHIKLYLIQFNTFRAMFYTLIQMVSIYFQDKPFIDALVDQCFKHLQGVQQSQLKQKKAWDIMTKCFTQLMQSDVFLNAFEGSNKLKSQFMTEFENRKNELNLSQKYNLLQVQLITDMVMNLVRTQFQTGKVEMVNKEVYHDNKQVEKLILIESKDYLFSVEKLKQFYLKKIKADIFAGEPQLNQRKEELYQTINKQYFEKLKLMQKLLVGEPAPQDDVVFLGATLKSHFFNPEKIYQELMLRYQKTHSKFLHQVISNFDFEKKIKDHQDGYIDVFIKKSAPKQSQQIKAATEVFLNFKQSMLHIDHSDFSVYKRFFFSSLIHASLYISKETRLTQVCVEIFDKVRFIIIGYELNNKKVNFEEHQNHIQIDKIITQEPIEDQFRIAQKAYNFIVATFNAINERQQLTDWDIDLQFHYDPAKVNTQLYNQTLVGLFTINQFKQELKILSKINELDVFFKCKTTRIQQPPNAGLLPSLLNQVEELTKAKKDIIDQITLLEDTHQHFVEDCKQLLVRAFSKQQIIKNFLELKNKYNIELKPEELYYNAVFFWEEKANQDRINQVRQLFSQSREKIFKKLDFKDTQTTANQIDHIIKSMMEEQKSPQLQSFYEKHCLEFKKFLKIPVTAHPFHQQVHSHEMGQIRQPVARRPISILKIEVLRNRLKEKAAYYQIGYGNSSEEQEKLIEFVIGRFTEYMKWFISRILQILTVQKEGDEFKVYQVRQQLQQADTSQEQLIRQLTDIYQVYGPKKEALSNATLLSEQQQVNMTYALCDMTPMERWNDYNESLVQLDLQREKKMVEEVGSGRWREQREELGEVLRKKVKRGTELWDEIRVFLGGQQVEKNEQEDIVQSESEGEAQNGLIDYNQKMLEKTRNQMRNRLKNMESNNHLMKQKEITIKTVQFVLESLPQYRQSAILQKAYLF